MHSAVQPLSSAYNRNSELLAVISVVSRRRISSLIERRAGLSSSTAVGVVDVDPRPVRSAQPGATVTGEPRQPGWSLLPGCSGPSVGSAHLIVGFAMVGLVAWRTTRLNNHLSPLSTRFYSRKGMPCSASSMQAKALQDVVQKLLNLLLLPNMKTAAMSVQELLRDYIDKACALATKLGVL